MTDIDPSNLLSPPSWSLAVGLIGRLLILIASGSFAVSGISWLFSKRSPVLGKLGKISFFAGAASIIGAFVSLGILFAANRFEYEYIYGHADTKNALAYRIAGIWSGQEGSFLLWATCSAVFALLTVGRTDLYRRWYTIAFSFFLGGLTSILAFESPFGLNLFEGKPFVPTDGLGLAPSLQNYWVVIHPPVIFLGFASLTALFALAFAALVEKDYETWIPIVRPWGIVSVTLVGLGLCMGGFWAYETLGWGGFWMWDPVENVSFVPWCFAAAFIHGVIVQATKKKWQMTNMLLGGLPFLVFVYGTFLTRSGFLSEASVHSFAEMDRSALKLLIILMAGTYIGFFGIWGYRARQGRKLVAAETETGPRREAFYMIGITALLSMGVATMIGMSIPFFQALRGQKPRIVEEGLYHQVLPWIFIPIMILMGVAPFVPWNRSTLKELLGKVYTILCVTIGITGLALFLTVVTPFGKNLDLAPPITMLGRFEVKGLAWIMVLFGFCVFVMVANFWRIGQIFKRSKMGVAPFIAHIGVAILMAGLIISRGFEQKGQSFVMQDRPGRLLNYEVRLAGMTSNERDRDNKLKLDIYDPHAKGGAPLFTATPGLYKMTMADGQESTMVWPHIERGLLMDTYVSLGQPQTDASQDVTLPAGESTRFGTMTFTYVKMTRSGEFGVTGTRFGAQVKVTAANGATKLINPEMEIGQAGKTIDHAVKLDDKMELAMIGMNAADKSVVLRVRLLTPLYPIEIYHKPMTILVWMGTAIITFSGLLSAFYRRRTRKRVVVPVVDAPKPVKKAGDLVTAIQGKQK